MNGKTKQQTGPDGKTGEPGKAGGAAAGGDGAQGAPTLLKAKISVQKAAGKKPNKSVKPVQACKATHADLCKYQPVQNVIAYIHGEMKKNAAGGTVAKLKKLDSWGIDWTHPIPGMRQMERYVLWYEAVKTGGPWDHKPKILQKFGTWTCDKANEINYQFDIWSNVHYGYIGRAAGFSEADLLSGAGVAQLKVGLKNVPDGYLKRQFDKIDEDAAFSALDDPADQAAIKVGFDLWEKHGKNVSTGDILQAVRAASSSLTTKGCDY